MRISNSMGIFLASQIAALSGEDDPVPDFLLHYKLNGTDASLTRVGADDFRNSPECNDSTGSFYNGSGQYETANPDSGLVAVGTGPFSISLWFLTDIMAASDAFGTGSGNSNDGDFRVRTTGSGGIRFRSDGANKDTLGTYNDGLWHTYTVTSTGALGTILIYIDGVLENTLPSPDYNLVDIGSMRVGSSPTNSSHWEGGLDGVRFYDRVLTPAEVTDLHEFDCREAGFPCVFPCEFPEGAERNFTTLSAAGSMYYMVPDQATAVTSTKLISRFSITGTPSGTQIIAGRHSNDRFYIAINATGFIIGRGSTFSAVTASINDGRLHTVVMEQIGTALTLTLDGVEVLNTITDFTMTMTELAIGRSESNADSYFDGVVADVEFHIDGVLLLWYPIDEDWSVSTNLKNNATVGGLGDGTAVNITTAESEPFTFVGDDWLGDELIENGDFSSSTGWTVGTNWTIAGGIATGAAVTSATSNRLEQTAINGLAGIRYRMELSILSLTTGEIGMVFGGVVGTAINSVGDFTEDITATGTGDFDIRRRGTDFTGTIDDVSVKRLLEVAP